MPRKVLSPINQAARSYSSRFKKEEPYTCPELRLNHGIPAGRMRAFQLPSRVGNTLTYPDGRVERLPTGPDPKETSHAR